MKTFHLLLIVILAVFISISISGCDAAENDSSAIQFNAADRIQPYPENPFYWQYKGEPVWLVGGSWQDNLFNHPGGLAGHLDLLVSVGGNYARNVMSHRNVGNVFAYEQNEDGFFDLDHFNDEYWERFENFLDMTYERDIIVQIEIWDPWDKHADHQSFGGWSFHPFNPANNITWTPEESGLPTEIDFDPQTNPTDHPFWYSVPLLSDNELLLNYQKAYVDKLLSYSLNYPHILYCMNNETGEPNEWGDFWADYVRESANEAGVKIEITDMRRNEDIRSDDHLHIFDQPERYTFVDISQNNAWNGLGEAHYESILYVRDRLSAHPRPINNNKNYGAARHGEEESVARMARILFAGSASARFHRPHPYEDPDYMEAKSDFGMGLSPRAQNIIQSLRMTVNELAIVQTEPRNDLLSDRDENEAYLLAEPGKIYALYYPNGGSVILNLESSQDQFEYRWLNLDEAEWSETETLEVSPETRLSTPSEGHWIVVLKQKQEM
jgi:hypothetical protein